MSRRPGFALLLSLALAAALSLVGIGAMAIGAHETALAGAVERIERARLRAETAALRVVEDWSTRRYLDLQVGDVRGVKAGSGTTVEVVRLDAGLFLVRSRWADARAGSATGARAHVGLLVRAFDLRAAAAGLPAALSADREALVTGGSVIAPDDCEDVPAVLAPATEIAADAKVVGATVIGALDAPKSLILAAEAATTVADILLQPGTVRPGPVLEGGACVAAPTNWGSSDPGHPCYALEPVIVAAGPLTVAGGSGRGVLIVEGDLLLTDATSFEGVILATGRVVIEGDATISGAIRGVTVVLGAGKVHRPACDLTGLLDAPALDRAFRPPSRWWVPAYGR